MSLKFDSKRVRSKSAPSKSVIKLSSGLIGFALIAFLIAQHTQFLECVSNSLQGVRYLLVLKSSSFKWGDIVSIKGHGVSYVEETCFAKRILGLPGDRIIRSPVEGDVIRIESETLENVSLPLLKETKDGNPLTPISDEIIPDGYAFVAGDSLRSFDSRYEEFGLVPIEKIWGKAICAW